MGAVSPCSKKDLGLNPVWGLSLWGLHVVHISECVLAGYPGLIPQSKDMHGVQLLSDSKLALGVNVRMNDCLYLY